jgi:hypothetical protein
MEEIGPDNPLRQVIINTHSPSVVMQVPPDSLLVADLKETLQAGRRFKRVNFSYLSNTWREPRGKDRDSQLSPKSSVVSMGKLLAYLNPIPERELDMSEEGSGTKPMRHPPVTRVVDRQDLQLFLPGFHGGSLG